MCIFVRQWSTAWVSSLSTPLKHSQVQVRVTIVSKICKVVHKNCGNKWILQNVWGYNMKKWEMNGKTLGDLCMCDTANLMGWALYSWSPASSSRRVWHGLASTSPTTSCSPLHHYQALGPLYHFPPRLPLILNTKRVIVLNITLHYHLVNTFVASSNQSSTTTTNISSNSAQPVSQSLHSLSRSNP